MQRLVPILRRTLVPLALGGVTVFGFAPYYLYPLPLLALAALMYLLRRDGAWAAFGSGYLFGLGWFLGGVSWVYVSMHDVGGMSAPLAITAVLAFAAFLAIFPALALGLAALPPGTQEHRWLWRAPVLWALLEWTRGWIFTGFPWQSLGFALVPASPLAGYAPVLGVFGVSGLAAFTAAALASRRAIPLAWVAGLWLLGWGLGQGEWTRPAGPPVTVSLVQGNIAQEMKFRPEKLQEGLDIYRTQALASPSRLIVLPETAIPVFLDTLPWEYVMELADLGARRGGLLVGAPDREGEERYYNSVVAFGDRPPQIYRKVHLVPFGEFVPWGFRWFVDLMEIPLGDFHRGLPGQPPMDLAGQQVAVNICYEDVFGEELIHALPQATLMANLSNDGWFGHSLAPWQHLQIGQMRALETGRWWLRANNTGITAILDHRGRVVHQLPPFTTATLHGEAQGRTGLTPFARWGHGGFLVLALGVLALSLGLSLVRRPVAR